MTTPPDQPEAHPHAADRPEAHPPISDEPEAQASETSPDTAPNAVLIIDKPLHKTSMAVCARVRGKLRAGGAPKRIKVGHGGTLDPLATGVLVVLIGRATKRCDEIMVGEKGYTATVDLARTSPTDDLEAQTKPFPVEHIPDRAHIERTIAQHFIGTIMQAPPAYSAMKVDGKRAYELARAGKLDRLDPRPVRIDEITITAYDFPNLTIDIRCGKGTYIRSLARDLGVALGTGGVLAALRRTRVGAHTIDNAIALDDLPRTLDPWDVAGSLVSPGPA